MEFVSDYVLVDIETTGLSPYCSEIIEIGALKVRDNKVIDTFSTLIKPDNIINENITNLTGITNEMVEYASNILEVLKLFESFIGDNILIVMVLIED